VSKEGAAQGCGKGARRWGWGPWLPWGGRSTSPKLFFSGEETPSGSAARSCSTGGGELHSQVLERSIKEQPITAEDQGQVREEDGRKKNASRPSYLHQGLGHKKPRPAPQMEALHLSMYAESKNEMMSLSET